MIKDFQTFINEGMWRSVVARSDGKEVRKEDGERVHTCLGIDMIIHNPDLNWEGMGYDDFIKEFISNDDWNPMTVDIDHSRAFRFSQEEMTSIRNFKSPYAYMIYDGNYGTDWVAAFNPYSEAVKCYNEDFKECVDEHDYIEICKCVATKLKDVGKYLEYISGRDAWILGSNNKFEGITLELIDASGTWNWECEQIENEVDLDNYIEDFKNDIIKNFPELEYEDFIVRSNSQGGYYVGLDINVNNLNNIEKYVEYTKKWFDA